MCGRSDRTCRGRQSSPRRPCLTHHTARAGGSTGTGVTSSRGPVLQSLRNRPQARPVNIMDCDSQRSEYIDMSHDIINVSRNTDTAPIGCVSTQTVECSHYNNMSAQLPVDPKTGAIVVGGVKEQAIQCLNNMNAIVDSIDHVMDDVVTLTIFVTTISDIALSDEVYTSYFQGALPTRTTVDVAALPMNDALVQSDALISNGEGTTPRAPCALIKVSQNTDNAPHGLYSQTSALSHYNNRASQLPIGV